MSEPVNDQLWKELMESADVRDDLITGAVLVLRTKNMDTGRVSVCVGHTEDTDDVVQVGLIESARDMIRQNPFLDDEDDE